MLNGDGKHAEEKDGEKITSAALFDMLINICSSSFESSQGECGGGGESKWGGGS